MISLSPDEEDDSGSQDNETGFSTRSTSVDIDSPTASDRPLLSPGQPNKDKRCSIQ